MRKYMRKYWECGFSCDAYHVTNTQADGIYRCMKDAIKQTGIAKKEVDYV